MSWLSGIFGGTKTLKEENKTVDPRLTGNAQENVDWLRMLRDRGYQEYGGPRVADPTGDQNYAYGMVRSLAGSTNPYSNEIQDAFRRYGSAPAGHVSTVRAIDNVPGAPGTAGGSTQDYMNPYTQAVLNPQLRELGIAHTQNQLKNDARATMGGAFGDARSGLEAAQGNKDYVNAVGDVTGQAYSNAFDRAMALKSADINRMLDVDKTNVGYNEQALARMLGGGQALMGLDKYETGRTADIANLLNTYGKEQRGIEQSKLDAAYEEYAKKTGYPIEIAKLMVQANNPQAYGSSTTTRGPDNTGWGLLGALGGSALSGFGGALGRGTFSSLFGGDGDRFGDGLNYRNAGLPYADTSPRV